MVRPLATILTLALAGGQLSAGEGVGFWTRLANDVHDANAPDAQLARLRRMLEELIERQSRLSGEFKPITPPHQPPPKHPRLGRTSEVVLKKGCSVTVAHTIAWNHYPEDELDVTLTASDASLVVPGKLVLNFERHPFRFSHEIKAGERAGEFTVTLHPAKGKAVEVKVTVR